MVKIGKGLNRCPDCQVPKELCYCARIVCVDNKTPVSIIMHQRERFLTSNTAVVATRALKNSEILLRGMRDQSASTELKIKEGHVPLVLYPAKDALAIGSEELRTYLAGRPAHLIVPDGSWRQAKRVAKREVALENVQAVVLSDTGPSLYRLRRQVQDGRLCTFEAIARALGDLESLELEKKLMSTMASMDHAHAMARGMDKFDDGNPDPLTQRLFLGIRVGGMPPEIKQLQENFEVFDWVDEVNYHLTLNFIGRLRQSQKSLLIKRLSQLTFKPFQLEFDAVDAFDDQTHPSVIWIKPKESIHLMELQKQARAIIEEMGIPLADRDYTPHWTILRTRGHKIAPDQLKQFFTLKLALVTNVDRVILFEGHAGKGPYLETADFKPQC